jgi:hypothetical protein
LVASVIGNIFLVYPWTKAWFVPFYLCDKTKRVWMISNIQGRGFVQVMSSRYKNSASAVGSGSCAPKPNNILLHHGVSVFFRSQFIQKLEYWGDTKRLLSHLHNSIEVSSYDMPVWILLSFTIRLLIYSCNQVFISRFLHPCSTWKRGIVLNFGPVRILCRTILK